MKKLLIIPVFCFLTILFVAGALRFLMSADVVVLKTERIVPGGITNYDRLEKLRLKISDLHVDEKIITHDTTAAINQKKSH